MSLRGIAVETLKLPPLRWLARRLYDRFFERQRGGNHYRGVYASHAEAMRHVPVGRRDGFNTAEAATQYRQRIHALSASEYPVLLWLCRLLGERQRTIFDLGGHFGLFYYALQRHCRLPPDLRWTVCDLPMITAAGRDWAQTHDPGGRLDFTETPALVRDRDVLLVLGTLQYLDYSLKDLLEPLDRRPPYVIVNLTPMHPTRDFHTIQNMGFAFTPYHIISLAGFVASMQSLGYTVVDRWQSYERDCHIPLSPEYDVECYSGFVLQHASAEPLADFTLEPSDSDLHTSAHRNGAAQHDANVAGLHPPSCATGHGRH